MKKLILFLFIAAQSFVAAAQDDLMNMLDGESTEKPTPVYATFKSTRLVNLHSNETMKAKHLDFRIQHRFQPMEINKDNVYGLYNMFGLDGAVMRLGFEYGVTDNLMVGVGRSNVGKTYDFMGKYKILKQSKGKNSMPLSVDYFANTAINTTEWTDKTRKNLFTSRLSFVHQLIITRKFNDKISLMLSPTFVHHNLVKTKAQSNDIYAVGVGASIKLSRSVRFNVEYIPRLNNRNEPKQSPTSNKALYYDAFAIGLDIETGGHVFQLHFTNAGGLIEQQFIAQNTTKLDFASLRFGFNLSRTFTLEK
ncbi:MAG: hypothetical protein EAY81_08540 [Bacteroidetes bacterium]|nr:MAG: hypothetical protein EAY81_08540 [Bacteroidota bacterium]